MEDINDFLKAVKDGNVEIFKELSDNDSRLLQNATSPVNNTALHIAARFGQTSIVQDIVQRHRDLLFVKNQSGDTPMHVAARAGHTLVIKSFIDCIKEDAADVESGRRQEVLKMRDNKGNTPLHGAVMLRHLEVVEVLLSTCPELASLTNKAGQSAFSIAIEVKSPEILRTMVDLKVPVHLSMGYNNQTLLHGTILRNDIVSMNIILQEFPELISSEDKILRYPLHYAATLGYIEMVDRLLEHEASIAYRRDRKGQTPVHIAAWCGHLNVFIKLFERCPSSIELLDVSGRNILHVAAANGKKNIVEYKLKLPEMEDLVNARDELGKTPLHFAAINFQSEVVHVLSADPRVDIRATDFQGITALQRAEQRHVESGTVLVNDKADTRMNGSHSETEANVVTAADASMELRRDFTLKALKEANERRVQDPEEIIAMHFSYKSVRSRKSEEMAKTLIMIATLVATFTFTAGFTIPGGFKSTGADEGLATLRKTPSFQAFILFDTIAMILSMTVAALLSLSLWWNDDKWFPYILLVALLATWTALYAMAMAFITGVYSVLTDVTWLSVIVFDIGLFLPSCLLVSSPFVMFYATRQQLTFSKMTSIWKMLKDQIELGQVYGSGSLV